MAETSLIRRFFSGIGRAIDVLRTVLGRLLFLVGAGLIVYFIVSGPAVVTVPEQSALVLEPTGRIVEQESQPTAVDLLTGPQALRSTRLQEVLDALERAADDPRITSLVLHFDELVGVNPAQMEAIGEALEQFRESGKPIHAYGEYYSQAQYALAAHADSIMLHPMGNLMLQGYGGTQLFFRDLLERLDISMHVFRAGEYKSAAEPFTRMDLSEESRENNQQMVDQLWNRYTDRVSAARDLERETLLEYANQFPQLLRSAGGNMAQAALQQGLIDQVGSLATFRQQMIDRVGQQGDSFRQIHFENYLQATSAPGMPAEQRVGVIVAEGTIMPGEQPRGAIGAQNLTRLIRQAAMDDSIGAVVLRIDSPGGAATASETIRAELERLQNQGKPVVVSMGGTAASGGYWIASTADRIWAEPTTVTGSIGVLATVPSFENALQEIGVGTDGVGTTPLTRGADPLSGFNESALNILQINVEDVYQRFLNLVAQGRGMDMADVREVAEGRVWTGVQAQERGLVDSLGGLSEAVASAAELAGMEDWSRVRVRPPRSFSEQLLEQLLENVDPAPAMRALWSGDGIRDLGVMRPLVEQLLPQVLDNGQPRRLLLCEFCLSMQSLNDTPMRNL